MRCYVSHQLSISIIASYIFQRVCPWSMLAIIGALILNIMNKDIRLEPTTDPSLKKCESKGTCSSAVVKLSDA